MEFQREIVKWYNQYKRALPWRNTTDAYVIWLSEIILQQTRVEQGMPYFERFLLNYPTVTAFANATEDDVLKLWQGLGYYSRGRNMLYTAKFVLQNYQGVFPTSFEELIKLKGVGAYTAAAISSFSSNERRAVVDGNVFRVLARYFGIDEAINSPAGKKIFEILAQELIEDQKPAVYNQAIMEFGALQCKPKQPLCGTCPLLKGCYAFNHSAINRLPVKLKKAKVKERFFNYLIAVEDDQLLMKKRGPNDIWQNMYDFPLVETPHKVSVTDEEFNGELKKQFGPDVAVTYISAQKHLLTHQIIYVQFFVLDNYIVNFNQEAEIKSVTISEFARLPHPKVISDFFEKHVN